MFLLNVIVSTTLTVRGRPNMLRGATKQKDIWHRRLCHAGHARIQVAARITTGIKLETAEQSSDDDTADNVRPLRPGSEDTNSLKDYESVNHVCEPCALSKQTRVIYHDSIRPTTAKLERVHTNL